MMSGSYGAPDVNSPPEDVYSEAPNAYSEPAESVYGVIRNPLGGGLDVQPPSRIPTPPLHSLRNTNSANSHTIPLDSNIVRPRPVHDQDFRAGTVSPPLNPPSRPALGYGWTGAPPTISQRRMDEGKMSVSIDFGESSAPGSLLCAHKRMQGPRSPGWCVKHVVQMNERRIIASRLSGLHESPKAKCSKYCIGRVSSAYACLLSFCTDSNTYAGSFEQFRKVTGCVTLCTIVSKCPDADPDSPSLRQRRSSHCMGTGSQKFRPAARCSKMRMVRIPKWEYGQDL